jgi:hypothetical protein
MKKWWRVSWGDLFAEEKTRGVAIILFLVVVASVNGMVVFSGIEGKVYTWAHLVDREKDSSEFWFWFLWNLFLTLVLDMRLIGAVRFLVRERNARGGHLR